MRSSTIDHRNRLRGWGRRGALAVMVIGALLLGFVAYQLWGTGIQHANAQRELRAEFDRVLTTTTVRATTEPVAPATSPRPTTTTISSTVPSTVAPGTSATPSTSPPTTVPPPTAPPTTSPPPPTTVARPVYAPGDPVLRLEIPKIGVDEIVVSGVGVDQLKLGPGHFPQTPYPGEPGNAAIAGHRTTYGAPFFALDELVAGDEIITTTALGRYVYRVTEITIVAPSDIGVLAPTDDARLTLTSCHPRYSARERLIVSALLEPPIAPPAPEPTAPPPTAAATIADATTVVPTTTTLAPTTTTTVAVVRVTSPPTAPTTTMAVTSAVGGTLPAAPLPLPDASGLGGGWFADAGAWPHVLLWGAACAAVVALAVMLGRRAGHGSLGWLVGAVPFVVGLYFFYENVNRLLPAGV